jgi:hypothetical protein
VALLGGFIYKVASFKRHEKAAIQEMKPSVQEIKTPVRMIDPAEFVEFKLPNGWNETARFVDPENGNTIYLRNGRMVVVPKGGTRALADTDLNE